MDCEMDFSADYGPAEYTVIGTDGAILASNVHYMTASLIVAAVVGARIVEPNLP